MRKIIFLGLMIGGIVIYFISNTNSYEFISRKDFKDPISEEKILCKTDKVSIISYAINYGAIHSSYFIGLTLKSDSLNILKITPQKGLSFYILNDSLLTINPDEFKDEDTWVEYKDEGNHEKLSYSNQCKFGADKEPKEISTNNLNRGLYLLKNDKLIRVDKMNESGIYFYPKYSQGIIRKESLKPIIDKYWAKKL